MDPIVNRPNATQPMTFTPAARPFVPDANDITAVKAPDVGIQIDTNRVDNGGGLAGAAARADGTYVTAPDVPTRSKPADPPTPHDNFKQATSESLLVLNKLAGFFDDISSLDPASQPLYLRIGGLVEALGDRLYNALDKSTMSQDQLVRLLKTVEGIRTKLNDKDFHPDPSTTDGRREIDSLFTQIDSAMLVGHGDAKPPSVTSNFKQAAMEEISLLNKVLGFFDPIAQLEPASQPLYRKMSGMLEKLNDKMNDLRNPTGMEQSELLKVLRASRDLRKTLGDKDFKAPDPHTADGRAKIEGYFAKILPFVDYKPADPPTPRQNFKQAASESLLYLNKLGGFFDSIAQLDPATQPLFLRLGGLTEVLSDRLFKFDDPTSMNQDQLLQVLRAVDEVKKKFDAKDFHPDPSTADGKREIDSLFTKLDAALVLPHGDAKPPSVTSNFKQAAMEEISLLNKLLGFFGPIAQLEPDSQPQFRLMAGMLEKLNDKMYDLRNPTGMEHSELLKVLRSAQALRKEFDVKDFKAPDARTTEGRARIAEYFKKILPFVDYKPAEPPTPRQNFMQAGMESLSLLNKLSGYFDDFARLEDPSKSLYLRIGGLVDSINNRTLNYYDKTGMAQGDLLRVLKAAEEIRAKFADKDFKPDPKTTDGRREIDSLFTKLDSAMVLPHDDAKQPTLQDNFRQGGMEALSVLNKLGGLFNDLQRLEPGSQPLYLKLGGLINTISDRLYGYNRLGSLHPASLTALLGTAQAIRDTLNDKDRIPKVDSQDGRDKIDGFLTTLANQIGLPFA